MGRSDILAAEAIFGPNVNALKGKTVRHGEFHVKSDILPIPRNILSLYHEVTLCIDIMYVNKIAFLVTISRNIKFATIELLANCQEETIGKSVTNVMQLYGSRGFLVNMTHANSEFEATRGWLADAGLGLNVCSMLNTSLRLNVSSVPSKSRRAACTTPFLSNGFQFS
jgi:hypothetical protein